MQFLRALTKFRISSIILGCSVLVTSAIWIRLESFGKLKSRYDGSLFLNHRYAKIVSLGHTESLASLIWVKCLVEYGNALLSGLEYKAFTQHVLLVTTLDERFFLPYYYLGALTHLKQEDTTDIAILEKGVRVFPDNWRLALFLALRLSEGPRKDPIKASKIMEVFASHPDPQIPDYIRRIYRTFLVHGLPKTIAVQQLLEQYFDPQQKIYQKGTLWKLQDLLQIKGNAEKEIFLRKLLEKLQKNPQQWQIIVNEILALSPES